MLPETEADHPTWSHERQHGVLDPRGPGRWGSRSAPGCGRLAGGRPICEALDLSQRNGVGPGAPWRGGWRESHPPNLGDIPDGPDSVICRDWPGERDFQRASVIVADQLVSGGPPGYVRSTISLMRWGYCRARVLAHGLTPEERARSARDECSGQTHPQKQTRDLGPRRAV